MLRCLTFNPLFLSHNWHLIGILTYTADCMSQGKYTSGCDQIWASGQHLTQSMFRSTFSCHVGTSQCSQWWTLAIGQGPLSSLHHKQKKGLGAKGLKSLPWTITSCFLPSLDCHLTNKGIKHHITPKKRLSRWKKVTHNIGLYCIHYIFVIFSLGG